MSSSELTEWIAYEKITGPLGRRRQDIQAAIIATTIANANRGKTGKKFKISDFLIEYDKLGQQKSPEDMIQALRSINAAMGGVEING